jgi:hypothetical protein
MFFRSCSQGGTALALDRGCVAWWTRSERDPVRLNAAGDNALMMVAQRLAKEGATELAN